MKRTFVILSLLCISVPHAQADHMVYTYHDTIRPHGHKRPDAVGEANIRLCDERAGVQYGSVSPAYKRCMRELGYRYVSRRLVRTPEPLQDAPDDDSSPPADIDIPSPPPPIDMTPPPQMEPGPAPDIHPFCTDTIC
jgi:hypothetical protein